MTKRRLLMSRNMVYYMADKLLTTNNMWGNEYENIWKDIIVDGGLQFSVEVSRMNININQLVYDDYYLYDIIKKMRLSVKERAIQRRNRKRRNK